MSHFAKSQQERPAEAGLDRGERGAGVADALLTHASPATRVEVVYSDPEGGLGAIPQP